MHIALISPGWPIGLPNGIVTYAHHLKTGLERLGHEVSVLSTQAVVGERFQGVYRIRSSLRTRATVNAAKLVRRIGVDASFRSPTALAIVDSLLRLHARKPLDVVEMEESFGWCGDVQPLLPMPLVVKLHGPAFLSLSAANRQDREMSCRVELEGQALRAMRSIVAPSVATMTATVGRYGLAREAVISVPNPVADVDSASIWHRAGSDPANVLFVGRFDYGKGADAILAAFALLAAKRSDLTLTFVGPDGGLAIDENQIVDIRTYLDRVFEPTIAARVRVVGCQSAMAVQALRTKAAAIVCASRGETFGYIVAEAMMQGCPIAAFDVNGVSELLVDERTALLAPVDDVYALAVAIERLLDNPEQAARLGAQARLEINARCGVENIAQQMVEIYRRAVRHEMPNAHEFA